MDILFEAVKIHDEKKALEFKKTEEWATVEEMMLAHGECRKMSAYDMKC